MEPGSSKISQEVVMPSDADSERRQTVLFFGKTGDGKTTLCNMLIPEVEFKTGADVGSVSKQTSLKSNDEWTVIDTVGLGDATADTKTNTGDAANKFSSYFATGKWEVDHICFVMRKGEFSRYERLYWNFFKEMFGTHEKHLRLIFTSARESWLRDNEVDIEELFEISCPMIAVDFPPKADDDHEEYVLCKKREKNFIFRKFLTENRWTGERANIGQDARKKSAASAPGGQGLSGRAFKGFRKGN